MSTAPETPAAVLSSVALGDAFDCASAAILLAESGDPAGMRTALLEAFAAADGAFAPGSPEAEALSTVLSAVLLVPEAVA